jgi:hypothetical protein
MREEKSPVYNISHDGLNKYLTESRRWRHCDTKLAVRRVKNGGRGRQQRCRWSTGAKFETRKTAAGANYSK